MSIAILKVNGSTHQVDVDPDCPLLYVLRDNLLLTAPEFGCGLGQCGACTVLVDDRPTRSCQLPTSRAAGKSIVTIEGLGTPERPHPLQTACIEEQAFQCGYCLSGWVLTAKALLDRTPRPSDEDIEKRLPDVDLPVRQPRAHLCGCPACRRRRKGQRVVMAPKKDRLSRREFVKDTGGLLIGFSIVDAGIVPKVLEAAAQQAGASGEGPGRLNAWLRIDPDGIVRVFAGKAELGMGVQTAYAQIVAEEMDIAIDRIAVILGDTALTPDQGGVGGSTSIFQGAKPLRNAAASARALLLQLASRRLEAPTEQLEVHGGVIAVKGNAAKNVSYKELAGSSEINEAMKVSGQGAAVDVQGSGTPKDPGSYTIVGTSVPRIDLPPKLFGKFKYATSVRVDNMLHGRVVRPPAAGVTLVKVDDTAAKAIPGFIGTVTKGNFVGVVAENEWSAVRAARALKVSWSAPTGPFPEQRDLYQFMRTATPKMSKDIAKEGDAAGALAQAAKRVEASYEFPYQAHATMGPGCAVVDVRPDGVTTVWGGAQKMHALQRGIAELVGVPIEKVRVIWVEDSGSYGRCGFEDAAADAAVLSQAIGRPVRVQWARSDMTAWGLKGPAVVCDMSAALDAQGEATALQFTSRAFSAQEVASVPATAGNMLAAQLIGMPNKARGNEFAEWGSMALPYRFKNLLAVGHMLTALGGESASPLRTAHLRDPNGPATTFAVESFMDEVAAAAGMDPIEFRLKHLDDKRARGVLTAAVEHGWERRASPGRPKAAGDLVTGRGIAVGTRRETYVATVAEVEVNRRTGAVRVTRFTCFHDCGLIVNPNAVRGAVLANLIQSMSRSLKEEVTFDRNMVTSVDWATYPVARSTDIPAQIEVVLLSHPEILPGGVGETSSRPTAAAIANAIFDATGVRMRRVPFTPTRIKEGLAKA